MIFTIPGEPQGKLRPRYSRRTGVMYTPTETTAYEKKVAAAFYAQGGKRLPVTKQISSLDGGTAECEQPIKVEIWAFMEPPQSAPKKRKALMLYGSIMPTKKPDIDNIGKIILDALNGAAWKDDKAVTELTVHKRFDDNPRVVVEINEL